MLEPDRVADGGACDGLGDPVIVGFKSPAVAVGSGCCEEGGVGEVAGVAVDESRLNSA
jgi:hypothetical protein